MGVRVRILADRAGKEIHSRGLFAVVRRRICEGSRFGLIANAAASAEPRAVRPEAPPPLEPRLPLPSSPEIQRHRTLHA